MYKEHFFTGHLRIYDNLSLHIGILKCNQFPFLANIPQPRFLRWRELYPVRLNETCSDEVLGRPIPQHSHCQPNSVQRTHEEVISSSYGGSRGAGSRSDFPRRRMQFWVSQGEPTALPPARRPSSRSQLSHSSTRYWCRLLYSMTLLTEYPLHMSAENPYSRALLLGDVQNLLEIFVR